MKITDYLIEKNILMDLKVANKEDAIKQTAALLKGSPEVSDFDLMLRHIYDREALNTTAIGNNIAIPHARTDAVGDFVIAFGRAIEGIDFNSLDSNPVKLIFLMATPKNKGLNSYLQILAYLTRLLGKEKFREALLRASDPKEVISLFKSVE